MKRDDDFGLHKPKFDTTKIIERLRYALMRSVGGPVMRLAGPELEDFLQFDVEEALRDAYAEAEMRWQRDQINLQHEYSALMLKSVLAGVELASKEEEDEEEG